MVHVRFVQSRAGQAVDMSFQEPAISCTTITEKCQCPAWKTERWEALWNISLAEHGTNQPRRSPRKPRLLAEVQATDPSRAESIEPASSRFRGHGPVSSISLCTVPQRPTSAQVHSTQSILLTGHKARLRSKRALILSVCVVRATQGC
jgi:hypothetical protein